MQENAGLYYALFNLQFLDVYIMIQKQLLREGNSLLEEISSLSVGVGVTPENSLQY